MSLTTIQPSGINTGSQFSFNSIAITSTASGALITTLQEQVTALQAKVGT